MLDGTYVCPLSRGLTGDLCDPAAEDQLHKEQMRAGSDLDRQEVIGTRKFC